MLKQLMKPLTPHCRLAASCFIHCFPAAVKRGVSLWLWGYCRLEPVQGVLFILTMSHRKKKRRKRTGTVKTCVLLFPSALISRACASRVKDPPATSFYGPTNLMCSSHSLPYAARPSLWSHTFWTCRCEKKRQRV